MKRVLLAALITILFFACKKSNPKPVPAATPASISSLSVNSGPYNTTVIIYGSGFDITSASDKVFFNGKAAIVSAASTSILTVTVPLGAGTGNVTLSVGNGNVITGSVFTYEYTATITTVAGSGAVGAVNGAGNTASFRGLFSVAVDGSGNIYAADLFNNLIRKVNTVGVVSTFAGSGAPGAADGTGTAASFYAPESLAADAAGNLYVADSNNNLIRRISPNAVVTTLAGSGSEARTNGTGIAASFYSPSGVAVDAFGNVYVADQYNDVIRKITASGVVTTFAGSGAIGSANGQAASASFYDPIAVAVDATGNVYVADNGNQVIRKISKAGVVSTLAGSGAQGSANGNGIAASFNYPVGLAADAAGNVYVADAFNNLIRKVSPAGVVTTVAGSGAKGTSDGIGTSASFNFPEGLAIDKAGNLYVADTGNQMIRKITLQ